MEMFQITCWSYARSHAGPVIPYRRWSSLCRVHANARMAAPSGIAGAAHRATVRASARVARRIIAASELMPTESSSVPTIRAMGATRIRHAEAPRTAAVLAPLLSVIVLVYNEVESVEQLHSELSDVLEALDLAYEILYIDDGSRDGSSELMAQLAS